MFSYSLCLCFRRFEKISLSAVLMLMILVVFYAVGEADLDASSSQNANASSHNMVSDGHHQPPQESNVGTGLIASKHVDELATDGNLMNQRSVPPTGEEPLSLSPVPEPASSEEPVGPVLIARPIDSLARRTYFPPHWSTDATDKALKVGCV